MRKIVAVALLVAFLLLAYLGGEEELIDPMGPDRDAGLGWGEIP